MGKVKIGDKIITLVERANGTAEKKDTILTVIRVNEDGSFVTNDTIFPNIQGGWNFSDYDFFSKEIALYTPIPLDGIVTTKTEITIQDLLERVETLEKQVKLLEKNKNE